MLRNSWLLQIKPEQCGGSSLWGQPIMTSTRRGISYMWMSTQKIGAHWCHPVFVSCKVVGLFCTRISSLDGIKSGNFSL